MLLNDVVVKISKRGKRKEWKATREIEREKELGVGFKGQNLEACFMCNHVEDQDSWLILFSNHLWTFLDLQYYEEWGGSSKCELFFTNCWVESSSPSRMCINILTWRSPWLCKRLWRKQQQLKTYGRNVTCKSNFLNNFLNCFFNMPKEFSLVPLIVQQFQDGMLSMFLTRSHDPRY